MNQELEGNLNTLIHILLTKYAIEFFWKLPVKRLAH